MSRKLIFCCLLTIVFLSFVTAASASDSQGIASARFSGGGAESTYLETAVGNLVADAAAYAAEADIALIPGGILAADLPQGPVTEQNAQSVFSSDDMLVTVELSAAELVQLMEASVSHIVIDSSETIDAEASAWDGFLQISGFSYQYDAPAPVGERSYLMKYDSHVLDMEDSTAVYRAAMTQTLAEDSALSFTATGISCSEAVCNYAAEQKTISPTSLSRITPLGTAENTLISYVPAAAILILVAVFALTKPLFSPRGRLRDYPEPSEFKQ